MRRINFFDGAESSTVPVIGNIKASDLVSYADDASYQAENLGSPVAGNIYFNTTLNLIRYYNGTAWINVVDESTAQTLENKTIDGTSATGNNIVTTDADQVTYDNTSSGLTATDVQAAMDEVEARVEANESDIADIRNTTGTLDGDTNMGSYAPGVNGFNVTSNESVKSNIQELVTQVDVNKFKSESNETDVADLRSTTGTSDGDTDMGSYVAGSNGFNLTASQSTKQNIQELVNEVDLKINLTEKGAANGVAELDATGRVPASQLPSYVDDVEEYADLASFPGTGETGKIYTAIDTGKIYRWSGSIYVEISPSEVNSVNGQTGVVILDADDIDDSATTNKFASQAQLDKVDFISVTAPVDLDAIVSADGSIDTHSDVDTTTTPPVLDDVLKWDGSNWVPGVSSTVANLDDLTNVSASSPADGDFLRYDLGNLQWENKTAQLDSLSDVNAPSPNNGDILKYNSVSAQWENVVDSGGSGQGGLNYVINNDAEINLDNTSTDGSGNVTLALETVDPIRGSQSFRITANSSATSSHYAAFDLNTIDRKDYETSGLMTLQFDYYTTSGYAVGEDLKVELRRLTATASDIIPLDGGVIPPSSSKTTYTTRIQLDSDADSYELRFKSNGVTADRTIVVDNIKFGPDVLVPGAIVESGSFTIAAGSITPVSIGTVTGGVTNGNYARAGNVVHFTGSFSANLGTGVNNHFRIPISAFPILSQYTVESISGMSNSNQATGDSGGFVAAGNNPIDEVRIFLSDQDGAAGRAIWFSFSAKIDAQASAMLSTTETLFQTSKARISHTGGSQTVSSTAVTTILFNTATYQNGAALTVNTANNRIDVNKTGYYLLNTQVRGTGATVDESYRVYIQTGNSGPVAENQASGTTGGGYMVGVTTFQYLQKGDYVFATINSGVDTSYGINSSAISTYLEVIELPDFSTFSVYGESELVESSLVRTATGIPATATYADMLELPLTPGEWDLNLQSTWSKSTGASTVFIGISSTPGNVAPGNEGEDRMAFGSTPTSAIIEFGSMQKFGVKVTEPTTYYAKFYRTSALVTTWGGRFSARRIK